SDKEQHVFELRHRLLTHHAVRVSVKPPPLCVLRDHAQKIKPRPNRLNPDTTTTLRKKEETPAEQEIFTLRRSCYVRGLSVHRKTIHQTVTAGAAKIGLRAATFLSARRVRRVPRLGRLVVTQTLSVGMSQHHRARRATRIVLAGTVVASAERGTVRLRPSEDVVPIRRIATPVVDVALLRERRLLGQIVGSVQFRDVLGDGHAFGICPWSLADTIARVHRARTLGRQVGVPGLRTRANATCELLTVAIGTSEPAKVRTFADSNAGDEERHIRLLRVSGNPAKQKRASCKRSANSNGSHEIPPDIGGDPSPPPSGGQNTTRGGVFLRSRVLDDTRSGIS